MALRIPNQLIVDDRVAAKDKRFVEEINASLARLNEMRAVEINVAGHFLKSKIVWKLAGYQHALLHRIVALMDSCAVAWNQHSTLGAMLSARSLMETVAVFAELERGVALNLQKEDLAELDQIGQHGTFASRDPEWIRDHPELTAVNVLTCIDKFDKVAEGFRGHYDRLSERCHPNSMGHNFMFAELDHSDGTIRFSDEVHPQRNAHSILAAVGVLSLVETMSKRLDEAIQKVSDLQHRIAPVGARAWET
jgi:hypothetical protein